MSTVCSSSTKLRASRTRRSISSSETSAFLDQAKRDVFPHRERIKQRALLKHHPDPAAQFEQILFAHLGHFFAQNVDAARVGLHQPQGQLEQGALARARHTENRLGFSVRQAGTKCRPALACRQMPEKHFRTGSPRLTVAGYQRRVFRAVVSGGMNQMMSISCQY